ncbi:hypothetical protein AVEN_120212-1, partial [Araneus ventricosus]
SSLFGRRVSSRRSGTVSELCWNWWTPHRETPSAEPLAVVVVGGTSVDAFAMWKRDTVLRLGLVKKDSRHKHYRRFFGCFLG